MDLHTKARIRFFTAILVFFVIMALAVFGARTFAASFTPQNSLAGIEITTLTGEEVFLTEEQLAEMEYNISISDNARGTYIQRLFLALLPICIALIVIEFYFKRQRKH